MNRVIKQIKHQELLSHVLNSVEIVKESIKAVVYFPVLIGIRISLKLFGHTILSYTFDETWPFLIIDYYEKFLLNSYLEVVDKEKTITVFSNKDGQDGSMIKNVLYTRLITYEYYCSHSDLIDFSLLKNNMIGAKALNSRMAINGPMYNFRNSMTNHTPCKVIYFPRKN